MLTKQFNEFVESIQLDFDLIQYLIRNSIVKEKSNLKNKSLELLLDIFSLGFYIEQYLDDLLLVKEGEESTYFEKITDACCLLEMNKEKFTSRVFTESEEYFVAQADPALHLDAQPAHERHLEADHLEEPFPLRARERRG